jgi:hypothetical protein
MSDGSINLNSNPVSDDSNNQNYYQMRIIFTIRIIMGIICAYLAWECNQMDGIIFRLLITIIAFLFPEIYAIYYAIYHTFMGVKCYAPIVPVSNSTSPSFL